MHSIRSIRLVLVLIGILFITSSCTKQKEQPPLVVEDVAAATDYTQIVSSAVSVQTKALRDKVVGSAAIQGQQEVSVKARTSGEIKSIHVALGSTLKKGDVLAMDRGFIDRMMINHLKCERDVDVYIPLRKDMDAYTEAVVIAKVAGQWAAHPNPKRKEQKIARVSDLGMFWRSEEPEGDVELTGCVVWDQKKEEYYVFVTTDTKASARQIITTYELRPEIEEDYRQIKDFWNIEDFKSRKKNVIAFHIVCVLLGYLFFQLYTQTLEGEQWAGKSLPVALKKYEDTEPTSVILCVGHCFAIYTLLEIMQLYASLGADVRARLDKVLALA